jgi:hypothetical protein
MSNVDAELYDYVVSAKTYNFADDIPNALLVVCWIDGQGQPSVPGCCDILTSERRDGLVVRIMARDSCQRKNIHVHTYMPNKML